MPDRIVVAFPFTDEQLARMRAAAGPDLSLDIVDRMDDAAVDAAARGERARDRSRPGRVRRCAEGHGLARRTPVPRLDAERVSLFRALGITVAEIHRDIDAQLMECGWIVQHVREMNLSAGHGSATCSEIEHVVTCKSNRSKTYVVQIAGD